MCTVNKIYLPYTIPGARRPIPAAVPGPPGSQRAVRVPTVEVVSDRVLDLGIEEAVKQGDSEALKVTNFSRRFFTI